MLFPLLIITRIMFSPLPFSPLSSLPSSLSLSYLSLLSLLSPPFLFSFMMNRFAKLSTDTTEDPFSMGLSKF
jgi:hypothetical protein